MENGNTTYIESKKNLFHSVSEDKGGFSYKESIEICVQNTKVKLDALSVYGVKTEGERERKSINS
jgi:hypothetical protein